MRGLRADHVASGPCAHRRRRAGTPRLSGRVRVAGCLWLVGLALAAPARGAVFRPEAGAGFGPSPVRAERRFAQAWDDLTPDQRERALQNFQRYQRLPEKGRERMDRRYEHFQGLPPGEQDRLRRAYDAYRKMSPEQKQSLRGPRPGGKP